jgi:virulence-associated protein VapD
VFLLNGGAVSYQMKTQSITATSSMEAEFLAAVLAAKQAKYLHVVLEELGFPQHQPTLIYEDNMSAIKMINARVPSDHSCHIDIQHFAIQDWKDQGHIVMHHIPGVVNPMDDLMKPLGWVLHACHAQCIMGHYL